MSGRKPSNRFLVALGLTLAGGVLCPALKVHSSSRGQLLAQVSLPQLVLAGLAAGGLAWGTVVVRRSHRRRSWAELQAQQWREKWQSAQQDAAERSRVEAALQATEAELQYILSACPTILYCCKPSGDFAATFVSENVTAQLGYSPQDFLNDPGFWLSRVHPEDLPQVRASLDRLGEQDNLLLEYRFRRQDGSYRWMQDSPRLLRNSQGNPREIIGSWTDVNERKLGEQERLRQSQMLETILESTPIMTVFIGPRGKVKWANRAWQRTLGWSLADAQERDLFAEFYPDSDYRREVMQFIERADGIWADFKTRLRNGNTLETSWVNVRLPDGTILGLGQDITEKKKVEAQLRQAQKMEAFGQLAGGVAHDFNNILTIIRGNITLLQLKQSSEASRAASLREISDAAKRAADLTRQLLAFSRRRVLQPKDVDLNGVVGNMIRMLQRLIGEDITLQPSYAAGRCPVHADPGMMEQVLMNLAVNSRDAMPKGGRLVIRTEVVTIKEGQGHPKRRPGVFVRLSVEDTGCGIAPEHLPRLFEPFFTTKAAGRGTGLGLATIDGIVDQHQGWIQVESELGKGTAFHVYLPCLAGTSAPEAETSSAPEPRGGIETVLLVEDEGVLRALAKRVLEGKGYRVYEAANGTEALDVWQSQRSAIDLLLADLVLPEGMSGQDLAERLASEKPELKVLYTSGYSDERSGRHGVLRNGTPFLEKPYEPTALLRAVRDCLDGR